MHHSDTEYTEIDKGIVFNIQFIDFLRVLCVSVVN